MRLDAVLLMSIVFQLGAAVLALGMMSITRKALGWILIASALVLMVIRRLVTKFKGDFDPASILLMQETIAVLISVLMFMGMVFIRRFFVQLREYEKERGHLAELLEHSSDLIFTISPILGIVGLNNTARQVWQDLLRDYNSKLKLSAVMCPPTLQKLMEEGIPAARKIGSWQGVGNMRMADGMQRVTFGVVAHYDNHHSVEKYSVVVHGIPNSYRPSEGIKSD